MFHHFHDNKKYKSVQGSIDANDLYEIIGFLGRKNILDAEEFIEKYKKKKLKKSEVCLTFDDGLKCQVDVALTVLENCNIKAFFFIPTSNYEDDPNYLEVNRHFRTTNYKKIDLFYDDFYRALGINLDKFFFKNKTNINIQKKKSPFYTLEDIKFRLIRDELLDVNSYQEIMFKLFKIYKFDYKFFLKALYMDKKNIKSLIKLKHTVGLHSHSHPTKIEKLSFKKQLDEYSKNMKFLSDITGIKGNSIKCLSHPCGSYNKDTLKVLKKMKLEMAFKESISIDRYMKKRNPNKFEIAREDHSNIIKMMRA